MRNLPATSLWRDRQFLTFWSAQGVSEVGDRITELLGAVTSRSRAGRD